MKITVISAAYPLRGGIAQHTGIMTQKLLQRKHEVEVITFKRQYPKLLFPGKTQLDCSGDASVKIDTRPLLDSIGPLSWYRAFKLIRKAQPHLLLINYWMPFFALCFGSIAWLVKRRAPTRIVYLCHNIIPHERRIGDVVLTKFAFREADGFIVQSEVVKSQLLSLCPNARYRLVPHPVYEIFGQAMDKVTAKKQLDLPDEKVILFFGYVRAYKGLDLLLRAMPGILKKVKLKLLVVGEFYEDQEKYRSLIAEYGLVNHVRIHAEFVANRQVSVYFSAADVVVLPYKSATQSGIVQIAYHLNKPCIVTDVGGLAEVVVHEKTGLVVEPENPTKLAQAVVQFYKQAREQEFVQNVQREKKKYSWQCMIQAIEEFGETKMEQQDD
ncbi:MAG: glycosyltransferase [bacterium]